MPRPSKQPAVTKTEPVNESEPLSAWAASEKQQHPQAVYVFCGDGLGVPGLPHSLTLAEAERLELTATLKAALENRNYSRATVTAAPVSAPLAQDKE